MKVKTQAAVHNIYAIPISIVYIITTYTQKENWVVSLHMYIHKLQNYRCSLISLPVIPTYQKILVV